MSVTTGVPKFKLETEHPAVKFNVMLAGVTITGAVLSPTVTTVNAEVAEQPFAFVTVTL